ncbi:glycosyltransferase family 87 protein [Corynebacterium macclintockiae]|uniref:glycosyltransferase family 87 protein n=1 Tax=Corynebacterium macclintockiae TaxID=2913501 RepID=UPI00055791BA|nr:glycosyltransferase family 87 protein [Corynebacterium macclintockiae]MDK8869181.1 glycosyltransferase family 87 protein [Corynebacterium macclintockiae]
MNADKSTSPRVDTSRLLCVVFWPLALMTFIHRAFLHPWNARLTDDFGTVINALYKFRAHEAIYDQDYSSTDPHYLYSPGATLLLSPLSLVGNIDAARAIYVVGNAIAAVLAVMVLTKLFGFRLTSWVVPVGIFFLFSSESIANTLGFGNINGVLLLAESLFLWLLINNRSLLAGLVIGLAITVKPQFLPLLFIPLMRRQLSTIGIAVAIPVGLNAIAFPLTAKANDYFDKLLPYLGGVRDFANSSIPGVGVYFGFPDWTIWLWRILAALGVIVALAMLLRFRDRDPVMWSATTAGVLLTGVFLISSLGQMYYSMLLLPMIFTVLRSRSVMHTPVAWLGVYLFFSFDEWFSDRWVNYGRIAEYTRGTIGWSLLIVSAAVVSVLWFLRDRRRSVHPLGDLHTNGLFYRAPAESVRERKD